MKQVFGWNSAIFIWMQKEKCIYPTESTIMDGFNEDSV